MSTTPKKSRATNAALAHETDASVDDLIDLVADRRREVWAAARRICELRAPEIDFEQHYVRILDNFTSRELAVFEAIGWDRKAVHNECYRQRRIAHFQAIAGTGDDRAAAKRRAIETREEKERRAPLLREEIARLQAELERVESDSQEAAITVEQQAKALVELRNRVPAELADSVNRRRREAKKYFASLRPKDAEELERMRNILAAHRDGDKKKIREYARNPDTLIPKGLLATGGQDVAEIPWLHFIESIQQRLPALESEFAAWEAAREAAYAEIDKELDVYAR